MSTFVSRVLVNHAISFLLGMFSVCSSCTTVSCVIDTAPGHIGAQHPLKVSMTGMGPHELCLYNSAHWSPEN